MVIIGIVLVVIIGSIVGAILVLLAWDYWTGRQRKAT